MNREAQTAVNNAVSFEVKKDALQQRQNGDWMLRLVAQAVDMKPVNISHIVVDAPMGTRFLCTLVELNDDETAVDHKAMERDKWRELGPARQAGMRCKDPVFWAFLIEEKGFPAADEIHAAEAVREICGVSSRSDLGKPGHSAQRLVWHELDFAFQAWRAKENA